MRWKLSLLLLISLCQISYGQFLDPIEKATLDYYYDSKTNSINGARIIDGTLTTNKFTASILDLWLPRDGSKAMQADLPMGGFKITNLGAPTLATDGSTKKYVDDSIGAIPAIPKFTGPGTTGLVSSVAGDTNKFLRGDGSWIDVTNGLATEAFVRTQTNSVTTNLIAYGNANWSTNVTYEFCVLKTNSATIAHATDTTVLFEYEIEDPHNVVTNGTYSIFTAPVAGTYLLGTSLLWQHSTANTWSVQSMLVRMGGGAFVWDFSYLSSIIGSYGSTSVIRTTRLTSGQQVYVQVYQYDNGTGSNLLFGSSAGLYTMFYGARIGD